MDAQSAANQQRTIGQAGAGSLAGPRMIYLIGSLRNENVPKVAASIRTWGFDVFDDWYAAGPEADDKWQAYEQQRGRRYVDAIQGKAARNVHSFDKRNLDDADAAVLVLPAGKSGHLELGYIIGQGKPGFILLEQEDPERWDVMYRFATVVPNLEQLDRELSRAFTTQTSDLLSEFLRHANTPLGAGSANAYGIGVRDHQSVVERTPGH